jgi:hypothetical protein
VAEKMGENELTAMGLVPPRVRLRVYAADSPDVADAEGLDAEVGGVPIEPTKRTSTEGELLAELHIGSLDPERGIIARAPGRDTIYRIEFALHDQIPIDLEALRTDFIAPSAPAEAVESDSGERM